LPLLVFYLGLLPCHRHDRALSGIDFHQSPYGSTVPGVLWRWDFTIISFCSHRLVVSRIGGLGIGGGIAHYIAMGSIALDLGVRIRAQLHCAVQFSGA